MRAKAFERADVRARRRATHAPDPRLRSGQLAARVHARRPWKGRRCCSRRRTARRPSRTAQGARDVVVASYVNFTAVLTMLRAALRGGADITLVCAGASDSSRSRTPDARDGTSTTWRSGSSDVELNDAAQACALIDRNYGDDVRRLLEASAHGRALGRRRGSPRTLLPAPRSMPTQSSRSTRSDRSPSSDPSASGERERARQQALAQARVPRHRAAAVRGVPRRRVRRARPRDAARAA